jgi:hypothetical protein
MWLSNLNFHLGTHNNDFVCTIVENVRKFTKQRTCENKRKKKILHLISSLKRDTIDFTYYFILKINYCMKILTKNYL